MPGRTKSIRKARVRWFSDKPKRKRKGRRSSPRQITALRLRDFAKYLRDRYGYVLPDDDAGRDEIVVGVNHLAFLPHPQEPINRWLEVWAPWLTVRERKQVMADALVSPQWWTADELAWRLHLTAADRTRLGITTIGAIDENRAARAQRRHRTAKERMEQRRRSAGVRPRKVWLQTSTERSQPWKAEGISRRTWYRRRAKLAPDGTGPCAP